MQSNTQRELDRSSFTGIWLFLCVVISSTQKLTSFVGGQKNINIPDFSEERGCELLYKLSPLSFSNYITENIYKTTRIMFLSDMKSMK